MATQTEICNLALDRIGDHIIQNITDGTPTANTCLRIYDTILEEVLRSANWNCAIERSELTENAETPPFEWEHSFALPEDPKCLRVIQMEDASSIFKVEGRNLLTNEAVCKIKWVGKIVNPDHLDALCTKAFYLSMAVAMAYNRTGVNTVKNGLMQELSDTLAEAKSIDALEGDPDQAQYSIWNFARIAGTRGRFRGANSGRW